MRKKNCKGRCEKRQPAKCNGICRTYDDIQYTYADTVGVFTNNVYPHFVQFDTRLSDIVQFMGWIGKQRRF